MQKTEQHAREAGARHPNRPQNPSEEDSVAWGLYLAVIVCWRARRRKRAGTNAAVRTAWSLRALLTSIAEKSNAASRFAARRVRPLPPAC